MGYDEQVNEHRLPPIYRCRICGAYVEEKTHCGYGCTLVLDGVRRLRLSKLLAALLRHIPHEVGLLIDNEGWASIKELVNAVRTKWRNKSLYSWLREEHVITVALLDRKGRFEVKDGKIRARYGHSIRVLIPLPEDKEVRVLYHGTSTRSLRRILREGIKPMRRLMVHLTLDESDALENAKRKSSDIAIITIDAERLRLMGHKVYRAGRKVYVTDYVLPSCIVEVREMRLNSN